MKRIINIFISLCLIILFLPVKVFADSPTYSVLNTGCNQVAYNNSRYYLLYIVNNTSEVRAVILNDSGNKSIYAVSRDNFKYFISNNSSSACSASAPTSFNVTNSNNYYYVNSGILSQYFGYEGIPIVNATANISNAIYYTFGEGAVDPLPPTPPPPNYGDLIDVRFNTSIAGSGSAAVNNIDHITWNPDHDSNEIMFDGTERVQIKAIAGNYTSSTRNGLLAGTVSDFDYNSSAEHMLAEYPVTRGYYDVTWNHVIEQLHSGSISDFLQIRKDNETWLKSGWIYQIRLVAGEYTGQWITIYNGTSSGVQNSLTIENSTELNTTLINTIQEINNINNSIDEDWTINNIVINMENSDGTESTDKPWWAYLLEAIVSLISGVLDFLGHLIGDLIAAIVDLFTFDSFDLDVILNFGEEQRESNNIVGQSINFFDNVVESAQNMRESDVVISYPGITLFDVQLLPAADYNLNDYVEELGLENFHQMAYLVTDGTIAICLISLVYRKIMGILRS